jgi:hypothetical protein
MGSLGPVTWEPVARTTPFSSMDSTSSGWLAIRAATTAGFPRTVSPSRTPLYSVTTVGPEVWDVMVALPRAAPLASPNTTMYSLGAAVSADTGKASAWAGAGVWGEMGGRLQQNMQRGLKSKGGVSDGVRGVCA